ncbi:MAG TPA: DUF4307 domain-containing protein [Candidatus Nanopelagicaceae bacterium]
MSEFSFSDRYGQKPSSWKRVAIPLLIVFLGWLVWAGLFHSRPEIRSALISFSVQSDKAVSIRYSVDRRTPEVSITCTLVAHDFDKNVIGEINDLIPAGAAHIERTTLIPTRTTPVNAGISRCYPTSQ